jgi:hypothetical protein
MKGPLYIYIYFNNFKKKSKINFKPLLAHAIDKHEK